MNERIIKYNKALLPSFIRGIISSGICPSLCHGGFYTSDEEYCFSFCSSGLRSLKTLIESQGSLPFPELLSYLRSVLEAARLLPDYLIPEGMISLDVADIYFDDNNKAMFVLSAEQSDFFESFISLCTNLSKAYPGCNADLVAERLTAENALKLQDCKSMLKILSRWQFEYR